MVTDTTQVNLNTTGADMIEATKYLTTIDDDTVIWRYMNFATFYYMLRKEALFFRRLDRYADQLEATLSDGTIKKLYEHRNKFPDATDEVSNKWASKFAGDFIIGRSYVLSNSWTISDHEEYAMWKIYSDGGREGVAIKSTGGGLKKSLERNSYKINLGIVGYDESALDFKDINIYRVATIKKKAYKYENEYRALITRQFEYNRNDGTPPKPKFSEGADINVDLMELIDEIYVSPFASEWFFNMIKWVTSDYLKGFDETNIIYSSIRER
jgi:hypothetical protein